MVPYVQAPFAVRVNFKKGYSFVEWNYKLLQVQAQKSGDRNMTNVFPSKTSDITAGSVCLCFV